MHAHRRAAVAVACVALVATAVLGCAPAPTDDDWVLTPISYDNGLDGAFAPEMIDTAYPMELISDTNGGFWGRSAGSYLHVGADGATLRRFNLDIGDPDGWLAAVSPTELIVSTLGGGGAAGLLLRFDTEAMQWDVVHEDDRALGAVSVADGAVYFVAFEWGPLMTFTVNRLELGQEEPPTRVSPPLAWTAQISIAAAPDGRVAVATEAERIMLTPDGEKLWSEQIASSHPSVAISQDGIVAWSGRSGTPGAQNAFVVGGSRDAREIIDRRVTCDPDQITSVRVAEWVTVDDGGDSLTVPVCNVAGMAWTSSRSLVLSVGTEEGAPLVMAEMPATSARVARPPLTSSRG